MIDEKTNFRIRIGFAVFLVFLAALVFLKNLVGPTIVYMIVAFIMVIGGFFAYFYIRQYFSKDKEKNKEEDKRAF